jgi:hypothetical protein
LQNKSEQIVDTSEVKDSHRNLKIDDSSDSENKEQILFRQTLEDEDTNVFIWLLLINSLKLFQYPEKYFRVISLSLYY